MSDERAPEDLDEERLQICLEVLEAARGLDGDDPRLRALERATAHLRKAAKKARKRARARKAKAEDRARMAATGRWRQWDAGAERALPPHQADPTDPSPAATRLHRRRACYVCKQPYRELHFHYHALCPPCAAQNWAARERRAALDGRRALVTGGRVKIGFELVRMLLRDGARVTLTTRFPADAARRFAALEGFERWRERLEIRAVDLRYLPGVLRLCEQLLDEGRPLDILVHNAAQTLARPPAWYRELAEGELEGRAAPEITALERPRDPLIAEFLADFHLACREGADGPALELFPPGARDEEGRQLDLRPHNSWVLGLEQLDARELVEAQLVNAIAPALITARLRPLLEAAPSRDRHVVNVSAVEGQFAARHKTPGHPHTNMAKAALNMLTRTSAEDWARARIYINSVDTGWITQENPEPRKRRLAAAGFRPPLDVVDGAARIYDPIVRGVEGRPIWGCFLKDYAPAPW